AHNTLTRPVTTSRHGPILHARIPVRCRAPLLTIFLVSVRNNPDRPLSRPESGECPGSSGWAAYHSRARRRTVDTRCFGTFTYCPELATIVAPARKAGAFCVPEGDMSRHIATSPHLHATASAIPTGPFGHNDPRY